MASEENLALAGEENSESDSEQVTKLDGRRNNGRNLTQESRSKGGRTAHERGTAHKFTSKEATLAGRIGGRKSRKNMSETESTEETQE